jgi:hypothetical protein
MTELEAKEMFNSEFWMSNVYIVVLTALIVGFALFLARKEDREEAARNARDRRPERLAS